MKTAPNPRYGSVVRWAKRIGWVTSAIGLSAIVLTVLLALSFRLNLALRYSRFWHTKGKALIESYSVPLFITFVLVFVCLALWLLPKLQVWRAEQRLSKTEPALAENEFRKTLAQILGGIFVLAGLGVAWVEHVESSRIARDDLLTRRFTSAIEQLGDSSNSTIQLGGIYALERLAADSEYDHAVVMEVLTTFLRERTSSDHAWCNEQQSQYTTDRAKPDVDIQAALTVIARIDAEQNPRIRRRRINLIAIDVAGSELDRPNLSWVNLAGARMSYVRWSRASLNFSYLSSSCLDYAILSHADLEGAVLIRANLTNATLTSANLRGAFLSNAILDGAKLVDADLRGADGLTREQLESARLSEDTKVDPEFQHLIPRGEKRRRAQRN